MKLVLHCVLWLSTVLSYGQTVNTTNIILTIGGSRSNEIDSWDSIDTIFFYKLPENQLIYKIIHGRNDDIDSWDEAIFFYKVPEDTLIHKVVESNIVSLNPINLENVPVGEYNLKYKNRFKQLVITPINLKAQPINSVVLYPDVVIDYPQNTLAKLRNKDTISINYNSYGCFHTDGNILIITKKKDLYIAKLYTEYCPFFSYNSKKDKYKFLGINKSLIKSAIMTPENIKEFIRFENELNYAEDGGCTTIDYYEIASKYLNIKKRDGSCAWNGFYYLKASIFGKQE
jgi:hypothetical protein